MSELQVQHEAPTEIDSPTAPAAESTGIESVDAVVASLPGLDDLPVSEHVAVFETAHESLRSALSDASRG
jgi:hypothetical protein